MHYHSSLKGQLNSFCTPCVSSHLGRRGTACRLPVLIAQPAFHSTSYISTGSAQLLRSLQRNKRQPRSKLSVKALVAVDYSQPAIWLGLGLIGGGLGLYQLRRVQPVLSRDFDVVVSSILIFSGGILIFQGWRLDPLLLFCQLLTAGTALAWALEAISLRKIVDNEQKFDERTRQYPPLQGPMPRDEVLGRGIPLPAPRESDFGRWYDESTEADLEEVPTVSGRSFYSGRGQDAYPPIDTGDRTWDNAYYNQSENYGGSFETPPGSYSQDYKEPVYYDQGYFDQSRMRTSGDEEYEQPSSSSRVVDEVQSFYKKGGSVVEDVERFYDGGSQQSEDPNGIQEGRDEYQQGSNGTDAGDFQPGYYPEAGAEQGSSPQYDGQRTAGPGNGQPWSDEKSQSDGLDRGENSRYRRDSNSRDSWD